MNRCNNRLQEFRCNSPMTCGTVGRCSYAARPGDPGDRAWEPVGNFRMVEHPGGYVSKNFADEPRDAGILLIAVSSFGKKPRRPVRDLRRRDGT